jgi:hypothetical protein
MQSDDSAGGGSTANGAVVPCPFAKAWIAIELVGEDDRPIANERYAIVLPDGSERQGTTDARGRARIDAIPSGTCDICFPDLDRDVHEFLESAPEQPA